MNLLDILLLLAFAHIGLMYWAGNKTFSGWASIGGYSLQLLLLILLAYQFATGEIITSNYGFNVMDMPVQWSMSGLGWFFALITVAAALIVSWYSFGAWEKQLHNPRLHHTALSFNVASMLLLLSSGDFISLFIGWELVSWASFLIMAARGSTATDAALRYLMYAMTGAMLILVAIVLIYIETGDLSYTSFWAAAAGISSVKLWAIFLLAATGFLIKLGAMPFHLWQAEAYAYTPGANAAFLSAISARMGLFALALIFIHPTVMPHLSELTVPIFTFMSAQDVLIWLAALTAIIPTFIALQQNDARLLLAWHGIGQSGFILMGLALATPMGLTGGLLHVFNYATYQAALFLAVTAVVYRTGTSDLDRLGGLITKMPLTYIVLLMGIIGLAGMPPMNGFVSKWIIYKALLDFGSPLLLVAATISTLGTILSVYKLIHNMFLGQLRKEHYAVKEVPLTMLLPMLLVAGLAFITGVMPGLALGMVDIAQQALGYELLPHHIGGIPLANGGLNMLWVFGIFMYGLAVSAVIFYFIGGKHYHTHQWDNYAGGHFLNSDTPFHYSHNFYPGLKRVIGGWYKSWIVKLEQFIINLITTLSGAAYGLYRLNYTPLLMVIALVTSLAWILA